MQKLKGRNIKEVKLLNTSPQKNESTMNPVHFEMLARLIYKQFKKKKALENNY